MRRTRSDAAPQDAFDLFPYIGLLVCFLGALLLATLGMASLSIGPNLGETWQLAAPEAGAPAKTAVLIEWDGKEAVVHEGHGGRRRLPAMQEVRSAGEGEQLSVEVRELIREFGRKDATTYPLFAVRPSGFDSFRLLALNFRRAEVDIGYEPVGQDRPVQLGTQQR